MSCSAAPPSSSAVGAVLSSVALVPSICSPLVASSTAITPPQTIAESARLNTGQCGSSIQSTT
jgi:hypothetical protein